MLQEAQTVMSITVYDEHVDIKACHSDCLQDSLFLLFMCMCLYADMCVMLTSPGPGARDSYKPPDMDSGN